MARTNEERIRAEREGVKKQADLHERKHGQTDTYWHTTLKRLDKELEKIEQKKKKKTKKKGGPLPKEKAFVGGEINPGDEIIIGKVVPDKISKKKIEKENNDG